MRMDRGGVARLAVCLMLPTAGAVAKPPTVVPPDRAIATAGPGTPEPDAVPRIDAASVLDILQRRYGSLRAHHERGQLIERIDVGDRVENRTETTVECVIREGRFAVTTTARRLRAMLGRVLPVRSGPGVTEASRDLDQWIAPHAVLDREARTDLGPAAASRVRIDDRDFIRLDLEGGGDRLELFVNPETVLVERASGVRPLPGGGSWRGQLDVRTVGEFEPPAEDLLRSLAEVESAVGPASHVDADADGDAADAAGDRGDVDREAGPAAEDCSPPAPAIPGSAGRLGRSLS